MSLFELVDLLSFKMSNCFYGDLRSEFVEDRLTKDGEFLLRCSPDYAEFFASLKCNGELRHFRVTSKTEGCRTVYTFDSKHTSTSFDSLIKYHFIHKIPLDKDDPNTVLCYPVTVPKFQYNEDDIEIIRRVGGGAFGDVFKVKLKPDNIFLAMKTMKEDVNDEERASFLREIQMMKCMTHKNIVAFVGVVVPPKPSKTKQLKILLEYINQGSLQRILRRGKVLLRGKFRVSWESAEGIMYLHNRAIIHRDIASRNILLQMTPDGVMTVKVSDFGLSRIDEKGRGYELKSARKLPLKWMAPENFEKRVWTKASDVWSFGVLVWEIFSDGKEPYSDPDIPQSPADLSKYICAGNINRCPKDATEPVMSIMKSCWMVDPQKRLTIVDVVKQLKVLYDEFALSTTNSATNPGSIKSTLSKTTDSSLHEK